MTGPEDLLASPPATLLPEDPAAASIEAPDANPYVLARQYPQSSLVWAVLAERALADGRTVIAYAFARTGYHRGLDALRKNGWRGSGPIPWEHEPNRGFFRALHALGRAATAFGEDDEAARCAELLKDSSPEAAEVLNT